MPLLGESNTRQGFSGAVGGYEIENSAVFNGSDEGLVRTNSGTATGAAKKFTLSWWWKDANPDYSSSANYYHVGNSGSNWIRIGVGAGAAAGDWELNVYSKGSSGTLRTDYSNKNFRDPHGWHHFVVAIDTNSATAAANRKLMYHNGVVMTKRASNNFADDETFPMMTTGNDTRWAYMGSGTYMPGYLTHCALIDGQQLTPTSFGEFDDNGIWRPIDLTGLTFGAYGYWLKYEDSSNLGLDSSGNSNNFTATNMAASNQSVDTPTNNFPTHNSLFEYYTSGNTSYYRPDFSVSLLTNGNRVLDTNSPNTPIVYGSMAFPSSGKFYFEVMCNPSSAAVVGIGGEDTIEDGIGTNSTTGMANVIGYYASNGTKFNQSGTASSYGNASSIANGEYIGVAVDFDNDAIWFSDNGTWVDGNGSDSSSTVLAEIVAGTTSSSAASGFAADQNSWFPMVAAVGDYPTMTINFGQVSFTGTAPDGFKNLKTGNLPEPAIKDPSAHFQVLSYTGNGTAIGSGGLSVNQDGNSTFQPDLVWIKNYDTNGNENVIYDSIRGATKVLFPSTAQQEFTVAEGVTAFESDGFKVGNSGEVNTSSDGHVAWMWKAADAWSESAFGINGLASSGKRNPTAGFSIATWTHRTSANYAIKHGLSITPEFFIIKSRDSGTNWELWHKDLVDTGKRIVFDSGTEISAYWADASDSADGTGSYADIGTGESPVTASLFALQDGDLSGTDAVMGYFWHGIAGYSKFGTYKGNGSSDGIYIDLGFEPALIFLRSSGSNGDHWAVYDNKRPNSYEQGNSKNKDKLNWNSNHDHTAIGGFDIDFLANGVKLRNDNTHDNSNNYTYIYGAWAHAPFGGADTTEGTGV